MRLSHTLILCAVSFLAAAVARADLTHRYSFNDGTADDAVGTAHGLPVNGPSFQGGQLVFSPTTNNGTNVNPATGQYVDLPNNIASSRALTLETWTTYRGGGAWQRIADFGNNAWGREILPTDKTSAGYFGNGFSPIGQISVNSWGGPNDTDWVPADAALVRNVEQHIVYSHDPDTGVEAIYINGALRGRSVARYDASAMNYLNYWIGRSNFYQDPFYNGTINEFRIYDHGLTAAEVRESFGRGPDVIPEPGVLPLLTALLIPLLRRRR
jgi:hypothetical protein